MTEIKGTLGQIKYYNEENGYTIAEFETEDAEITVVGNIPYARSGNTYLLKGEYRVHPKYGEQFSFSYAEEAIPTTEAGIKDFLSSGAIKGIGPKTAALIVGKFGRDTLEVIEKDPDRLMEIDGIGAAKAGSIAESYSTRMELAEVVLEFSRFDITAAQAMKLYIAYGKDAVKLIKEDPYRLIEEVQGIGFTKADSIAEAMGIGREDPLRIESGIKAYLRNIAGDGNTYFPRQELIEVVSEFLDVPREKVDEGIASLAFSGDLMTDNLGGVDVVYLYVYYAAEQTVVKDLASIMAGELKSLTTDLESSIRATEAASGIDLSESQKDAVKQSVDSAISVITGGPGTGKTTIINSLIDVFAGSNFDVALAAPTGRAAKRMEQTTGRPALTVHRLLGYRRDPDTGEMVFGMNDENPLDNDVIIVDEASMIDLMLMKGLTDAIKAGTRLILVGDYDQLPSVGAGNVLHDIIESGMVKTVMLTEIFRQAEESMIVVNAHRINTGEYPVLNSKGKDFFFMQKDNERDIADLIRELVTERLPAYYDDIDALSDIQVLTPTHKGNVGTDALNLALQDAINPKLPGVEGKKYGKTIFRQGDKVMQIKNNYDIEWQVPGGTDSGSGIFNGDVGYIDSIDNENGYMTIVFDDDKYAEYDFSMLDELELAYAMTVHKSQGNEFPVVVMPVSSFSPMLATRNLLYTAITRGKTAVILVGSVRWLYAMVDNNRIKMRYSGLGQRLSDFRAITGE